MPQIGRTTAAALALCLLVAAYLTLNKLGSSHFAPSLSVPTLESLPPRPAAPPGNVLHPPTVLLPDAVDPEAAYVPLDDRGGTIAPQGGTTLPKAPRWAALPASEPDVPGHLLPLDDSLIPLPGRSDPSPPTLPQSSMWQPDAPDPWSPP